MHKLPKRVQSRIVQSLSPRHSQGKSVEKDADLLAIAHAHIENARRPQELIDAAYSSRSIHSWYASYRAGFCKRTGIRPSMLMHRTLTKEEGIALRLAAVRSAIRTPGLTISSPVRRLIKHAIAVGEFKDANGYDIRPPAAQRYRAGVGGGDAARCFDRVCGYALRLHQEIEVLRGMVSKNLRVP